MSMHTLATVSVFGVGMAKILVSLAFFYAVRRSILRWPPVTMVSLAVPILFDAMMMLSRVLVEFSAYEELFGFTSAVGIIVRYVAMVCWIRLAYLIVAGRLRAD